MPSGSTEQGWYAGRAGVQPRLAPEWQANVALSSIHAVLISRTLRLVEFYR